MHRLQSGFDKLGIADISYFDALHGVCVPLCVVFCNEIRARDKKLNDHLIFYLLDQMRMLSTGEIERGQPCRRIL